MIIEWMYRFLAEPWERIPVWPDLREHYPAKVRRRPDYVLGIGPQPAS